MINRKNIQEYTDEEIVIAYKEAQHNLFVNELYNRYSELVYGVCLKYLKNREQAKDTFMQIFGELMNDLVKYKIDVFKPWLYQKTKNKCFMELRKKKTYHESIDDTFIIDESLDDLLYKQQQDNILTELEQAINLLNDKQQQCIRLFYLDKKSYQEIEQLTSLTYKEIKSAIQNGKRNLKNNLVATLEKK